MIRHSDSYVTELVLAQKGVHAACGYVVRGRTCRQADFRRFESVCAVRNRGRGGTRRGALTEHMQLLSRAMNTARTAGFKKLQLDVLSDNPAVNFYQSMGLELLVESRAPKPQEHGVPPEWRMGIDL